MAWSLPRLLRRLRRSSLTSSTRCRSAGAAAVGRDAPRPAFRARPGVMGLADRLTFKTVVPRAARRAAARAGGVGATKRDAIALYELPPAKITVTPHGVDPAFGPGDGEPRRLRAVRRRGPGAEGSARRARRRTGGRPAAGRRRAREGAGARRAAARARRGRARLRSRRPSSPSCTAARRLSSCRPATRASASPCSRRWRAARRSSLSADAGAARGGGRRSRVRRRRRPRGRARSARSTTATGSSRGGPRARAGVHLGRDGAPDRRRVPAGARDEGRGGRRLARHTRERRAEPLPALAPAGRRARRDREHTRARCRTGVDAVENDVPLGLRCEPEPRFRADDCRARGRRRTRTPCPNPGAIAALRLLHGVAAALRRRRTAHGVPRRRLAAVAAAVSRRSPARSCGGRRCGSSSRNGVTSISTLRCRPSRSRPTGCSAGS